MRLASLARLVSCILLLPAVVSLAWLYNYPAFKQCAFPVSNAPFQLLALADPQLEGDTSLPDADAPAFPSLVGIQHAQDVREIVARVKSAASSDILALFQGYRKRLDLLGNDYYLAHIYRTVKWWTQPTHVVVLGDLLGSQWIDDGEFESRAGRFWQRVFRGASTVPIETTATSSKVEVLGGDSQWSQRVIAVAGNHDIGYAGDIDSHRLARFEKRFGHANWETRFILADANNTTAILHQGLPELRVVVLNTMNLDEPVKDTQLRDETLMFLGRSFTETRNRANVKEATIVLTHVPLHKEAGICVDEPLVNYFSPELGGGIREQNHLKPETSQRVLAGLAERALILNGHDHEGCDTWHSRTQSNEDDATRRIWSAKPWTVESAADGIREITVRSMMGSFGGNAGMLSASFNEAKQQWQFEYSTCALGVQHIWWAVHVLAIIETIAIILVIVLGSYKWLASTRSAKQKTE